MTTPRPGLRERKKQATRKALREAALRLALERGPDNVRVDDIAEAAAASPAASGLVVPSGSLPDLLRTALTPLIPALDAAEGRLRRKGRPRQ